MCYILLYGKAYIGDGSLTISISPTLSLLFFLCGFHSLSASLSSLQSLWVRPLSKVLVLLVRRKDMLVLKVFLIQSYYYNIFRIIVVIYNFKIGVGGVF